MDQRRMNEITQKDSQLDEFSRRNAIASKERRIKKKKQKLIKKAVKTSAVAIASFTLGILAVHGMQLHKGANNIANEFVKYTEGYEIVTKGEGSYIVNPDGISIITFQPGEDISIEPAYKIMIEEYKEDGASLAETWIGASEVLGKKVANKYVGEVSREEINATKKNAYHEQQIKEYNEEHNIGGISK